MANSTMPPNILLITTDQHRWDYMGCAGAEHLNTPNLDRLAARGVIFNNCYTNSPICVPARIGLATGMLPASIGSVDNGYFLPPHLTTYYQRLRDAGYRVACSGKLDLAKPDSYNGRDGKRPRVFQWGFTDPIESEGKMHSLNSPQPVGPYGAWLEEKGLYDAYHEERIRTDHRTSWFTPSELPAETFLDVYQGQCAVNWLQNTPHDSPWHMFMSFSGPHVPHDPPREYYQRYADVPMPEPVGIPEDGRSEHFLACTNNAGGPSTPEEIQKARRAYCAYIELIDEQIGELLKALEQRGELDNTYIFFSADHGEMLGDLGMWRKSQPFDPSIRVPLIAAGPGIPSGHNCNALVEFMDLNATICDLAGLPEQPHMHARSFKNALFDSSKVHRAEIVSAMRKWRCVRTERYKLVQYWNDEAELYDLQDDPHETRNCLSRVLEEAPALIRDLRRRLSARFMPNPYADHVT